MLGQDASDAAFFELVHALIDSDQAREKLGATAYSCGTRISACNWRRPLTVRIYRQRQSFYMCIAKTCPLEVFPIGFLVDPITNTSP